ncbi:hypothetical protein AKJ62_04190 [candidate division MSBL1 archaeon SCGC-AAA259D14]|uniref:Uncharacterized protein n=2 Tax=candidate division MSBL1 TaxID=215777 RepID=A0A133UTQ3_9EURY|nr:hypothetical protein AKJ62_04190 [candidate division MSBL1 archaeon SCGC-AAA259D14]KXA97517.1 hypothetical protein AKJ38_00970 [candidate division MSBL1 archaeon SCGC-AAA259I14]
MDRELEEIVRVELMRCIGWFFLSFILMIFLTGYLRVIHPSVWINLGIPIIITLAAFSSLVYVRIRTERTVALEPGTQAYKLLISSLAVMGVLMAVIGIGQYFSGNRIFGIGHVASGTIITTIGMHQYKKGKGFETEKESGDEDI